MYTSVENITNNLLKSNEILTITTIKVDEKDDKVIVEMSEIHENNNDIEIDNKNNSYKTENVKEILNIDISNKDVNITINNPTIIIDKPQKKEENLQQVAQVKKSQMYGNLDLDSNDDDDDNNENESDSTIDNYIDDYDSNSEVPYNSPRSQKKVKRLKLENNNTIESYNLTPTTSKPNVIQDNKQQNFDYVTLENDLSNRTA